MKCKKKIVLTGYRIHYVDLREPKPRTPKEEVHVVDNQLIDAMGFIGYNVVDVIKSQYEKGGYKVFAVEPIKPKRVVELDLCQLWNEAAPPIGEDAPAINMTEEDAGE